MNHQEKYHFFRKVSIFFEEGAAWKFYRRYLVLPVGSLGSVGTGERTFKLTNTFIIRLWHRTVLLQADDLLRAIRNLIRFESTFLLQFAGCQPPKGCSFKMCWLYVLLQYLHQWSGVTSFEMKLCGRIETLNWKLYLYFGLFYRQLWYRCSHTCTYESRLGSCCFWWIIKRLGSRDQITDKFISN